MGDNRERRIKGDPKVLSPKLEDDGSLIEVGKFGGKEGITGKMRNSVLNILSLSWWDIQVEVLSK